MAIFTDHQANTLGILDGATTTSSVDPDLVTFSNGQLGIAGTLDATNFKVGGAQGTDGQVLTSTGSGVGWADAGGGGGGGSNPSGFPYTRMPTKNYTNQSVTGYSFATYWYPSDLAFFNNSDLPVQVSTNRSSFSPWIAPVSGDINTIGVHIIINNITTTNEFFYFGLYGIHPGAPNYKQTPYERLGFGSFAPHGTGTGNKSAVITSDGTASGNAVSVVQGGIYWLAFSTQVNSMFHYQVNGYRRNSFLPNWYHDMPMNYNNDGSFSSGNNQTVQGNATLNNTLNLSNGHPTLMFATYVV